MSPATRARKLGVAEPSTGPMNTQCAVTGFHVAPSVPTAALGEPVTVKSGGSERAIDTPAAPGGAS